MNRPANHRASHRKKIMSNKRVNHRANRKRASNDAVEFLSILDAKGEFVGDLVTEIWENFPEATSDDVLKVMKIVDEADWDTSVVEDIVENSNFADPFLMESMANRLRGVAPIDIEDASYVMDNLENNYNKGFLTEMVRQSRTKSRDELIEYYQEDTDYTSHRANHRRSARNKRSSAQTVDLGDGFEVTVYATGDAREPFEYVVVDVINNANVSAGIADSFDEAIAYAQHHALRASGTTTAKRANQRKNIMSNKRVNHKANRKRAGVEDYFWFFIHNLTVPSDVDDPVDYLEDFLGQYFTDVMVNDYDNDFSAEVGDGNGSMEFFIRDTGHNVNDIAYLNEDGDYRPLSEIHTAKRANRKRAKVNFYFSAYNRSGDVVDITAEPDGDGFIWSYQGPDYNDYDKMRISLSLVESYNLFLKEMGLTKGDYPGPEIYYAFTSNHRANRRANHRKNIMNNKRANRRANRKVAQEYNGWFNWDTWAAYGSITADYDDYQRGIRATLSGNPLDLIAVFEDSVYREPDVDVSEVDWDEVYLALDEDN